LKLVADECFPRRVALALAARGHEVSFATGGSPDEDVLAFAHDLGAALLTEDTDFGDLAIRQGRPHFGIILLRMAGSHLDEKLAAVIEALPELEQRRFVVVKSDKARSR
jgi:predicted nuclease of predicted toxin-antitoxin system